MAQNKNTELLPAYLIVGEDALKRESVSARLRARMEKLGDLSFNLDAFDGTVAEGPAIVVACDTVPFASEKRLVTVSNADKLKKADAEALVAYLAKPSDTTVLCLEAEKLAKNTRLYKAVAALGKAAVIDCAPLKKKDLPRHVRALAVGQGVTFTEGAAAKLVELAGTDTVRLDSEVKKIALAHRGGNPVNESEVMSLVARTAEVKAWEFVGAFSARDLGKSLRLLSLTSASPYELIARCTERIRELICAQSVLSRGGVPALAKTLGKPDWQARDLATGARQFRPAELRRALSTSRDAEQAMKSGSNADGVFLEWVVDTLKRA